MSDLRLSGLTFKATVSCLKSKNNSTSQVITRVLEGSQPTSCWEQNDLPEGALQTIKYYTKCLLLAGTYLPTQLETSCQKVAVCHTPGCPSECPVECPPHDKWSINICRIKNKVSLAAAGNRWRCPTAQLLVAAIQSAIAALSPSRSGCTHRPARISQPPPTPNFQCSAMNVGPCVIESVA